MFVCEVSSNFRDIGFLIIAQCLYNIYRIVWTENNVETLIVTSDSSSRSIGYIPSNYVKEKELLGLQRYEYVPAESSYTNLCFFNVICNVVR